MNRLSVLLIAILVLLAGCSSVTDTPTPSDTATPTATPTTTPTSTPDASTELAPGIAREGITNPVALLSAHQRELLADGFVVDQTIASTYDGSPSNRLVMRTTVGPGGELAVQNATSTGFDYDGNESVITNALWLNTTHQVSRHVESGTTTYQIGERLYPPEALVWFGSVQRDIQFAASEYEVTGVEQRDGTRYVSLAVSHDRVGNDDEDDAFGTLLVDDRGVIHRATMNVTYEEGTVYRTTYTVVDLGVSEPEPPAWLDAVPPSAALDVGLDVYEFDEWSVELVHLHGDAVPAGSIVGVVSNGTLYETTLEEPFGDDRRYLWVGDDGTLHATTNAPSPDVAARLDTEVTITVTAPDGGELFSTSVGRR
jgi:hypothetical protein